MKSRVVRCPYQIKDQVKEYFSLFNYSLKEEKEALFSRYKLTFVREEDNDSFDNVEYKYKLFPFLTFIPVIIMVLIVLLLVTLFLIFTLTGDGERLTYFLYFMVPAFIILPLVAVYTYLRFHFDNKNINVLTDLNAIKKELEKNNGKN